MNKRLFLFIAVLTISLLAQISLIAQQVTPAVEQELARQGMTVEEARQQAQQLGINLNDPEQAAARARELGVPESRIQRMLNAVNQSQQPATPESTMNPVKIGEFPSTAIPQADTSSTVTAKPSQQTAPAPARQASKSGLEYFGYNLFKNVPEAFKPSEVGPIEAGYVVGPGDELRLIVWGAAEFQYDLTVDREGRIYVPKVGQLTVAGKSLGDLRKEIKTWLSKSYAGLTSDPPTVFMDLTVTRLRPVYVYVLGEVSNPGGYTVSSYATVFNVLYSIGGPKTSGSLRNIKVIRDGKVIATVDMYESLLKGYETKTVRLQSNDRIFIPQRGKTVAISGEVKRSAIYELTQDEGFDDLLNFAGGLTPQAYTKRFQITRIVPYEKRVDPSLSREVLDLNLAKALSRETKIPLYDGDSVHIYSTLEQMQNAVSITGAVKQPGRYQLNPSLRTIRDLIMQADSLTGDAYLNKADLVRVQEDSTEKLISLNLQQVLNGVPTQNIVLQPLDHLRIYSTLVMLGKFQVSINGTVRNPGQYTLQDSMTVYDLLFKGGGLFDDEYLKDVYLERADLYRKAPDGIGQLVYPFNLRKALNGTSYADTLLQPYDEIRIYPKQVTEYITQKFVSIYGAVKNPGQYNLQKNMNLEDLILQAGGFSEGAYLKEAEVTRIPPKRSSAGNKTLLMTVPLIPDALWSSEVSFGLDDSTVAMQNAEQFQLEHRDKVFIRVDPNFRPQETVTVSGEVAYTGQYTLLYENENLSNVLRRAGGVLPTGYPKGGRLVRNGENLITRFDLVVEGDQRADVVLMPGDEIIIPPQPNTVAVRGNVANEGLIKYEPGRRVSYYLDRAGGVGEDVQSIYLTQASGATFKVNHHWYWFNENPKVDDGAIIRVTKQPPKPEGERVDVGKTITDVAAVLSSMLTIIVLANRL